jgi:hypothetical protein
MKDYGDAREYHANPHDGTRRNLPARPTARFVELDRSGRRKDENGPQEDRPHGD